jgi:glycosyltransferase involved in cell wall biosynthesis
VSDDALVATVVVPTYNRPQFLPELLAALEAQTANRSQFEVVVVDNGSRPEAWAALRELAANTDLPLRALRLEENQGPAGARNHGALAARGEIVAFTDDDCLPTPTWLESLLAPFATGADVVQGRTVPPAGRNRTGAWERSVWVTSQTPLFETCNIAYRLDRFRAVGGFDEHNPLTRRAGGGRAFGEDALLGARVVQGGGRAVFASAATVHHRWLPALYRDGLRERRQLRDFPALARESAVLADGLRCGVFLSADTAAFDAAVFGIAGAVIARKPVLALAAAPWVTRRWLAARSRPGRHPAIRLAQLGFADLVGFASLVEGSIRNRRLIL